MSQEPPHKPVCSKPYQDGPENYSAAVDTSTFESPVTTSVATFLQSQSFLSPSLPIWSTTSGVYEKFIKNICEDDVDPVCSFDWFLIGPNKFCIDFDTFCLIISYITMWIRSQASRVQLWRYFIWFCQFWHSGSPLVPTSWTLGFQDDYKYGNYSNTSDRIITIYWVLKHNVQLVGNNNFHMRWI